MKKIISILGILGVSMLLLSACGNENDPTLTGSEETSQSDTDSSDTDSSDTDSSDTDNTTDVSTEDKNALNQADSYANDMNMSKAKLYDQLTSQYGGKFSAKSAQYAIDNIDADWNANALAKAKSYQDDMSMSPERIREQLTSNAGEKFTSAEADYAVANLDK